MSSATIRPARDTDVEALTTLYNHYVVSSPATFDIDPWSIEQRRAWMSHYAPTGPHRLIVAEEAGAVQGFASTSRFRPKAAYDTSVETTVYLDPAATGRGLGRLLYDALFELLAAEDVHRAFAGVTVPNPASVALHQAVGFTAIGDFHEAGRKFDQYWTVRWFEKRLG